MPLSFVTFILSVWSKVTIYAINSPKACTCNLNLLDCGNKLSQRINFALGQQTCQRIDQDAIKSWARCGVRSRREGASEWGHSEAHVTTRA